MIHLWTVNGSGRYPVCGSEGVRKGVPVTQAYYRDLCPACLAHQVRKSKAMNQRLRAAREKREQEGGGS